MDYVKKALEIAEKAHKGQKDKSGIDYIEHPKHIADRVHSSKAKAVAYLHDIIEDTNITASDLYKKGIPSDVVEAVVAMTHLNGEDYFEYINRLKKNKLAKEVKLVDLEHNMDLSRIKNPSDRDYRRLDKYRKAKEILLNRYNIEYSLWK